MTKCCSVCGAMKELDQFYAAPGMKDGSYSKCKVCYRLAVKEYATGNPVVQARDRARHRAQTEQEKERRKVSKAIYNSSERGQLAQEKWRNNNPEAVAAHRAVGNAVSSGQLIKPRVCPECGAVPDRLNMHAHHKDYAKPLEVEWNCKDCHKRKHRGYD